jgi:alpha-galactosidase
VELTRINGEGDNEQDVGDDFASTLGTGGVLGTKFTWPDYGPKFKNVYLNPGKEAHWKKWLDLYHHKMLSKGTFRDLYTYGYDAPEGYAIEKDESMYYAFFAPAGKVSSAKPNAASSVWRGILELRGLEANKKYRVTDYVNDKDYGEVTGPRATLPVDFEEHLLLQATPISESPRP